MSCYLVQEIDGTSRFTLEDASGFLLLEDCAPTPPPQPGVGGPLRRGRRRRRESIFDSMEEEAIMSVLLDEL